MNNQQLKFKVLKVRQPIGDFFIASLPARDIAAISYSDVRRMSNDREVERYLGVQRPLKESRVKEIQEYARSVDATFPTAVILSVDERCAEYDETTSELALRPYKSDDSDDDNLEIPYSKIAKVLDGQHRIAGFTESGNNSCFDLDDFNHTPFDLNVAIFIGSDIPTQANIFATVNLAQTKVNRSLAYDLYALSEAPSPFKTCHEVAMILDQVKESPLHKRIKRLGVKTPGRDNKEPLTLQAFVESLMKFISTNPMQDRNSYLDGKSLDLAGKDLLEKLPFRNLFIHGESEVIAKILFNYFKAVKNKWPIAWENINETGNLLPKANAFKALMKFLKTHGLKKYLADSTIPSIKHFEELFLNITMTDEQFNVNNLPPGSGGESKFYKVLTREIPDLSR